MKDRERELRESKVVRTNIYWMYSISIHEKGYLYSGEIRSNFQLTYSKENFSIE